MGRGEGCPGAEQVDLCTCERRTRCCATSRSHLASPPAPARTRRLQAAVEGGGRKPLQVLRRPGPLLPRELLQAQRLPQGG